MFSPANQSDAVIPDWRVGRTDTVEARVTTSDTGQGRQECSRAQIRHMASRLTLTERTKAAISYLASLDQSLDIVEPDKSVDLAHPTAGLAMAAKLGDVTEAGFHKMGFEGAQRISHRHGAAGRSQLAKENQQPYVDNRPLTMASKPEACKYKAVFSRAKLKSASKATSAKGLQDRENKSYIPMSIVMRKCALVMLGICLVCLSALAGPDEERSNTTTDAAQNDKTIGDTRVVLLAISSMRILASTDSTSNVRNATYLEIAFLTEHVGTNSFSTPEAGSVHLYLEDKKHKKGSLLDCNVENDIFINGSILYELPPLNVRVANAKECHSSRYFLQGLNYPSGARASCVIQAGFDGHLIDFDFNDIVLPCRFADTKNDR